ncbi:UNVERIFIED_CONTAM: hypothetical protein K2H54_000930 [Gekko kuhli]
MSDGKEIITPVTSGENVPVTTGTMTPPTEEEEGPTWGWFHPVIQETWSLTLGTRRESRYDASRGPSYITEDAGMDASRESGDIDAFVETQLGLLKRWQDRLAQMIEASFEGLP